MHPRQVIRDEFAQYLRGKTDAEQKVFGNRGTAIQHVRNSQLPVILIYTLDDERSERSADGYYWIRKLPICVDIAVDGKEDEPTNSEAEVKSKIDDIAGQVEAAVIENARLNNRLADDLVLVNTAGEIMSDGRKLVGFCRMDFVAEYWTLATKLDPDGVLPDHVFTWGQPEPYRSQIVIEPRPESEFEEQHEP